MASKQWFNCANVSGLRGFCFSACFVSAIVVLPETDVYAQQHSSQTELILIEVEDLRENPSIAVISNQIHFLIHDGHFDLFDFYNPANDELAALANSGSGIPLIERALMAGASAATVGLLQPSWDELPIAYPVPSPSNNPPISPFEFYLSSNPEINPYFSYFTRVYPSDDGFIANEDPKRYKLFDENGQFAGPFVIDVYGSDILDAGVQTNDELDLLGVDSSGFTDSERDPLERTEQELIRPHPGFIGSMRSGEDELGRLLREDIQYCFSQVFFGPGPIITPPEVCLDFDAESLDFTRPDYPLFRIRINASSRVIHGGWSGSYFNPARNGEGFSFEFFDGNPDRVTMFWYTYEDDGSGDQEWLIGQGEKVLFSSGVSLSGPQYGYEINLYTTRGGQLTSTQNPDSVELIPWGSARLVESTEDGGRLDLQPACERLRLYDIQPLDSDIELDLPLDPDSRLPYYELIRLGPKLSGAESLCGQRTGYPF